MLKLKKAIEKEKGYTQMVIYGRNYIKVIRNYDNGTWAVKTIKKRNEPKMSLK